MLTPLQGYSQRIISTAEESGRSYGNLIDSHSNVMTKGVIKENLLILSERTNVCFVSR